MKIGVLYIATGRYICFWEEFYKTAKQYLFKNHEVHFFVITDAEKIFDEENEFVHKYFYKALKWPDSVMKKFEVLLIPKNEAINMDYVYHFNANMKFVAPIGDEILPEAENGYLAICPWANYLGKDSSEFPYERNENSAAYIPQGEGKYYFMAGLVGGCSREYFEMCETCNSLAVQDLKNDIIPIWHDESIFNKFFLDKNPLIIPSNYCLPQNWKIKGVSKPVGVILKKHHWKYGGHAYLRGETDKKITTVKYFLNKIFKLNLK